MAEMAYPKMEETYRATNRNCQVCLSSSPGKAERYARFWEPKNNDEDNTEVQCFPLCLVRTFIDVVTRSSKSSRLRRQYLKDDMVLEDRPG